MEARGATPCGGALRTGFVEAGALDIDGAARGGAAGGRLETFRALGGLVVEVGGM
jgi:hypothetical protein